MNDPRYDRIPVEDLVAWLEDAAGGPDDDGLAACDFSMASSEYISEVKQHLREAAERLREEYL